MNENYFTEDIFMNNDIMYYKNKPIKKHNWNHILCEIGWNKMNVNWIKKLNSYHPNPYKNLVRKGNFFVVIFLLNFVYIYR